MRAAIYVTGAKWPAWKDTIVSGHVQIPLKTASLLLQRGYDVTLITTSAPVNYRIPPLVPLEGLKVKTVTKATRDWPRRGFDSLKAVKQFIELRSMLRSGHYDILHFFGANSTAYLLGLLKATGVTIRSLMTFTNFRDMSGSGRIRRRLFGRIDQSFTLTDYTKTRAIEAGLSRVTVTRPGLLKHFCCGHRRAIRLRSETSDLVLFWRNANEQNGADVCMEAFRRLSSEFPLVDFVFAVRPHDRLEEDLKRLAGEVGNIHLLLHPYPNGMTISDLVCSASCVVMPFRSLTMNPQFAVLETLSAGIPLVTTAVESNSELVKDHETGYLVQPSDAEEVYSLVKYVLEHKVEAKAIGRRAKLQVEQVWNWESYIERIEEVYAQISG